MLVLALLGCRREEGEPEVTADPCAGSGVICTVAGTPEIASFGQEGVPATESGLYLPVGSTTGPDGELLFIDWNNHRVRRIGPDGLVTTVAGTGFMGLGEAGPATAVGLDHPTDLVFDWADPELLWIAMWHNSTLVQVDLSTGSLRVVAGGSGSTYNGEGPAESRELGKPSHLAFDGADLYFVDQGHHLVRRLTDGVVYDVAGIPSQAGSSGDGGLAIDAAIDCTPLDPTCGIAIHDGQLYLTDGRNRTVRVIDLDTGTIDRFAGTGGSGWSGDGGAALDAEFVEPADVGVGPDGAVYVVDVGASCVRRIDRDGTISTFAGVCGTEGFDGDEGFAADAILKRPPGVDVSDDGTVYVADSSNHVIRAIRP